MHGSISRVVCGALAVVPLTAPDVVAAARPNVVVVMIDDLGWTDLACYGSDFHETPHLDRLARDGMRFTSAYAAAAVCTPTRVALMTGKHPARLGMTIWREAAARGPNPDEKLLPPRCEPNLPREEITLAELLRGAGYQTFHVGKWHLGDARHYPEVHGFDVNIGGTLWGAPATYFWPYYHAHRGPANGRELSYVPGLDKGGSDEYLTDRLTDQAIGLLQTVGDRPFFLHLAFHSVHTPIEGKPDLVARYEQKLADHVERQHHYPAYAAMVHSVDENIGRLLASLDECNLADNGGLVDPTHWGIATDNAPLRSGKGSLYEGGVRVPLIVRWPGIAPPASVCAAAVVTHDLFATVVEAAGVADPVSRDGLSLGELLRDPRKELPARALFWHYPHYYLNTTPISALRHGPHKLLHYYEDDRVELYDLQADLGERNNLASTESERTRELRAMLSEWITQAGAELPGPNPARTE